MITWLTWAVLLQGASAASPPDYTREDLTRNLAAWIAAADQNGDARLSRDEWQAVTGRTLPHLPETYLRHVADRDLQYYDRNHDGFVDLAELSAPSLEGFACLDTNHDGRLSAAERAAIPQATCLPTQTISD